MAGKRRRIVAAVTAAIVGAVLLGLAAALPFAPALAEFLLERILAARGVAQADVTVRELGWSGATFEAVRLGPGGEISIDRIEVDYRPAGLWRGRADRVVVEGLALRARLGPDGFSIGLPDGLFGGGDAADRDAGVTLPADRIVLHDGKLLVETPQGAVRAAFSGHVGAAEDGPEGELTLTGGRLDHGDVQARIESGRIAVAMPAGGSLRVEATLALADLAGASVAVDKATLTAAGDLEMGEGAFRFTPAACVQLEASDIRAQAYRVSGGPLALCPPADGPLLWSEDGPQDGDRLYLAGKLQPARFTVAMPAEDGPVRAVEAEFGAVTIGGHLDSATTAWQATAESSGTTLVAEGPGVAARGLALEAEASGTVAALDAAAATFEMNLHDLREAPFFAPLRLAGRLDAAGGALRFSGTLTDPGKAAVFAIEGRHALGAGTGEATIASRDLRFAPGGLQPQALLPVLRGKVASVAGALDLSARFAWTGDALSSRLDLGINDGAAQTPFAALAGIDGQVTFDSLFPPSTLPDQVVEIGLLDAGLPLRDGRITFTLRPDGRLELPQARWPLAGGEIRLEQAEIALGALRQSVVLTVQEVDLAKLLALFRVEGVTATGMVSGAIPVRIEKGTAVIENGRLATESGGVIRYGGAGGEALSQAGGGNAALLLKALENFHYESLAIEVSGEATGALDVALHISGANPELYGGHPFELNFNLDGELAALLRQGLVGYRIPDSIRRQLERGR